MSKGPSGPMDPIKDRFALLKIRELLSASPRDLALFVLGTNTALRAGDILKLNVGDVRGRKCGDQLTVKEQKTGKRRSVTINSSAADALEKLMVERSSAADDEPLFIGQKRKTRITVVTLGRFWKSWCKDAGIDGNFASHTGRKTWAYQQRTQNGASVDLLQKAFGHSSGVVTMSYACIADDEMVALYSNVI